MDRLESQSVRVCSVRVVDRDARVDYPRGESDFYVNTHTQRPAACFVPSSNTEYGPLHSRLGLETPCFSLKSGLDGQTKFSRTLGRAQSAAASSFRRPRVEEGSPPGPRVQP